MSEVHYGRGYVYAIQYHLVWCVKYRRSILCGKVEDDLKHILLQIAYDNEFSITEMESDKDHIHSRGSCYQFSLLLQTFYPDSTIYIRKDKKHTALMIAGQLYDVSGRVEAIDNFTPITAKETVKCEVWSSDRNLIMIEKKLFKQIEKKIRLCQRIIYVSYTIGQLVSVLGIYFAFNYLNVVNKPEFKWFAIGLMFVSIIWMQQLKKRHIQ